MTRWPAGSVAMDPVPVYVQTDEGARFRQPPAGPLPWPAGALPRVGELFAWPRNGWLFDTTTTREVIGLHWMFEADRGPTLIVTVGPLREGTS